jgi:hypothetical protein
MVLLQQSRITSMIQELEHIKGEEGGREPGSSPLSN